MDVVLKKSIRNGIWGFGVLSIFTFFFGGIYNEMITEGIGISLENILWALLGSILAGVMAFIPIFVISLIYFYFKEK